MSSTLLIIINVKIDPLYGYFRFYDKKRKRIDMDRDYVHLSSDQALAHSLDSSFRTDLTRSMTVAPLIYLALLTNVGEQDS